MNQIPFASAFAEPAGSPIRELFPYLSRPGMISFAGGYPSPALLDGEGLAASGQRVFGSGAGILQYGATEGAPVLREALSALCASRGVRADAAEILVTTGSQQAFDLLVRVFVEPGDTVYVETPAYPAAIQALRLAGARIEALPVDQHGLQTDALEACLKAAPADRRPRLLYTVPTFSNPCGTLLSQERRARLVRLADEYGFVVIEDDPYGELNFSGEVIPSIFQAGLQIAGARNPVVYLSSLSKTVAPALRIGWMVAPQDVLRRCAIAKQTSDLCTSPIAQLIAADYLASGRYPAAVARMNAEYGARMRLMARLLGERLQGLVSAPEPLGGMFMWARLDAQLAPQALFDSAVEEGVLYVPGTAFYPGEPDRYTLRLSYAAPDMAEIEKGMVRLELAARRCI